MGWRRRTSSLRKLVGVHLNLRHHATILVIENVAMEDEGPDDVRIAKIHSHSDAGVWSGARPRWNDDGVLQIRIGYRHSIDRHYQEVDLMNMEGVHLARVILDGPVLDRRSRLRTPFWL